MNAHVQTKRQGGALDPDLVEFVKALARANAARDIAQLRSRDGSASK